MYYVQAFDFYGGDASQLERDVELNGVSRKSGFKVP
jgi:hypothetical protein